MAELLWGKVFYNGIYAGQLLELPGEQYSFSYDESYLEAQHPPIAYAMPLRSEPYIHQHGLHPFFDNLVAEGWLENAQARLLGKRVSSRFELLLAFGSDCAGAVSVIDPSPQSIQERFIDLEDSKEVALIRGRASLSGIQPKVMLVVDDGRYRPVQAGETSTHIAKFNSPNLAGILENELLTTTAVSALLPNDLHVELAIKKLDCFNEDALIIKRFDRDDVGQRVHFEEFNQLLALTSKQKYDGAYHEMSDFIKQSPDCMTAENFLLFKRVLAGILVGNTDMHFKNFAMMHDAHGLRLTPNYDQVAAALYKPYQYMALKIAGQADRIIGELKAKNIIQMGEEFGLKQGVIRLAVDELHQKLADAMARVEQVGQDFPNFSKKLIAYMEKRWNGTFALIGKLLSKKL